MKTRRNGYLFDREVRISSTIGKEEKKQTGSFIRSKKRIYISTKRNSSSKVNKKKEVLLLIEKRIGSKG